MLLMQAHLLDQHRNALNVDALNLNFLDSEFIISPSEPEPQDTKTSL